MVITGFKQRRDQNNGMMRLWRALGQYRAPDTCVAARAWNADFGELAGWIDQSRDEDQTPPTIKVYAYSWGCGWGFLEFARRLIDVRLRVRAAVLADPVYHSRHWFMRWLALVYAVYAPAIKIPPSVDEVFWFYQRMKRPCGHPVVPEDEAATKVTPGICLAGLAHSQMDDAAAFQRKCMEVAAI